MACVMDVCLSRGQDTKPLWQGIKYASRYLFSAGQDFLDNHGKPSSNDAAFVNGPKWSYSPLPSQYSRISFYQSYSLQLSPYWLFSVANEGAEPTGEWL
ncbi:hypothetical protein GFPCMMHI_01137 [Ensifer adhaerens]|nr:hypothetical protein [Ensifer adhaerens]